MQNMKNNIDIITNLFLFALSSRITSYKCTFDLTESKGTRRDAKSECQVSVNSTGALFIYL
jgi:hypothetical protein